MARIDSFLRLVAEQKASDLHFCSGNYPIVRHDGDLIQIPFRVLSEQETRRFLGEILSPSDLNELDDRSELDFVYELEGIARFRVNCFQHSRGAGAVFRVIPDQPPTIESLVLPTAVRQIARFQNGLILVCGPTGCGKTTTLAALVHDINSAQNKHIITVEDPIEYLHEPLQSIITQRQVGMHTDSFASALRSALRESPDVVLVGEMRDLETISLALSAAETGVLVFGTLHTNSAAKAIDRIIDAYPDDARDQTRGVLSVQLRAVLSQRLLKRASGEGRVAAVEIFFQTIASSNMIRENKIHQLEAYIESPDSISSGNLDLDTCVMRLLREGLITTEEGLKVVNSRAKLRAFGEQLDDGD